LTNTAEILRDLLNYSLTEGQKDAEPLGYIPLPPDVVEKVKSAISALKRPNAS
jgi:phosphate transport system substrate-binding protein